MSYNPRIEEVDDDPEDVDISMLAPPPFAANLANAAQIDDTEGMAIDPRVSAQTQYLQSSDASQFKSYQCLYPIYFDADRSRAEGRKVSWQRAVQNPLAREIVDACAQLGLKTVFEPSKTHPKDWANPGRVRVLLKVDGTAVHNTIRNKFLLNEAVSEYLGNHPTGATTPLKLRIPGLPFDGKPAEPPIVPRGWKLNSILPLHSPALSGGGVSEDIFKEMMQGMGMGMGTDAGPSEKKEKKEKKKGKK